MISIILLIWLIPALLILISLVKKDAKTYRSQPNPFRFIVRDIIEALLWPRILLMCLVLAVRRFRQDSTESDA